MRAHVQRVQLVWKVIKAVIVILIISEQTRMPKKEKPLTKKERDAKRKARKEKQAAKKA
jgi:hypothetical protein